MIPSAFRRRCHRRILRLCCAGGRIVKENVAQEGHGGVEGVAGGYARGRGLGFGPLVRRAGSKVRQMMLYRRPSQAE